MGDNLDSGLMIQYVMSLLLKKIIVPSDYHEQVRAVKEIQAKARSPRISSTWNPETTS